MLIGMGEERTAGSDPKIMFSSGGPISLDHFSTMFERRGNGELGWRDL
jgi:hypothetical protein